MTRHGEIWDLLDQYTETDMCIIVVRNLPVELTLGEVTGYPGKAPVDQVEENEKSSSNQSTRSDIIRFPIRIIEISTKCNPFNDLERENFSKTEHIHQKRKTPIAAR